MGNNKSSIEKKYIVGFIRKKNQKSVKRLYLDIDTDYASRAVHPNPKEYFDVSSIAKIFPEYIENEYNKKALFKLPEKRYLNN